MKSLYKKAILAAVILPLTFSTVYAKQGNKGKRDGAPLQSMLALVDLTAEQQTTIDTIIQDYRDAKVKPDNKGDYRQQMQSLITADTFDTAEAKSLIESKDKLRQTHQLNKMKMTYDVYHVLTDEQQEKMDLLFAQYEQKMDRRGQGKKNNQ